jgi:hypothetical protein
MLTDHKRKIRLSYVVAGALLCATAMTLAVTTASLARPGETSSLGIVFANAPAQLSEERTTALALERFLKGLATPDPAAVWMFASEEEQDAFGTEPDLYAAYAEAFPELVKAEHVTFTRFWEEGDTDFVQALLSDGSGGSNVATMGFWLDDAGDWKLVSCDVKSLSDLLAER